MGRVWSREEDDLNRDRGRAPFQGVGKEGSELGHRKPVGQK